MIYTLEKRHEFEAGQMFTHYEVCSYTHITPIGVYAGEKTLKQGTLAQCEKYCRLKKFSLKRRDKPHPAPQPCPMPPGTYLP